MLTDVAPAERQMWRSNDRLARPADFREGMRPVVLLLRMNAMYSARGEFEDSRPQGDCIICSKKPSVLAKSA